MNETLNAFVIVLSFRIHLINHLTNRKSVTLYHVEKNFAAIEHLFDLEHLIKLLALLFRIQNSLLFCLNIKI